MTWFSSTRIDTGHYRLQTPEGVWELRKSGWILEGPGGEKEVFDKKAEAIEKVKPAEEEETNIEKKLHELESLVEKYRDLAKALAVGQP